MAKHRQDDIHSIEIREQHINQPTRAGMVILESEMATPLTTTDRYHHSETIWRVVLDVISLIICKNSYFLLKINHLLFMI